MKKSVLAVMLVAALVFGFGGTSMADSYKNDPRGTHDNSNGWGGPPQDNGSPEGPGGGDCGGKCASLDEIAGTAFQYNAAYTQTLNFTLEDGYVLNGSAAFGTNTSEAEFEGMTRDGYVIGFAGTFGGTDLYTIDGPHGSGVYGFTGNAAFAGLLGDDFKGKYSIYGEGSLATVSVLQAGPQYAVATSNGTFEYSGAGCGRGIVVGGGITAGGSYTYANGGHVTAAAGQVTVAGVGNVR